MKCPFCGSFDISVLDSRLLKEANIVKRRRYCQKCASKFSTLESVIVSGLFVIKKSGAREEFSRSKLLNSFNLAFAKRKIAQEKLESLVELCFQNLNQMGSVSVTTKTIAEVASLVLFNVDAVAYTRFLSVYGIYNSVDDFKRLLEFHPHSS